MEFATFAARAAAIETESADLAITDRVTSLLREAGADLPIVARYIQGRIFPAWTSTTLDIGPSLCMEAIARAAGQNVTADDVERRLAELGEIGAVAASFDLGGQRGLGAFGGGDAALSIADVDAELHRIAGASGSGSQTEKLDRVFGLFTRCSPAEARYLARLLLAEMRIGVGEGTVRDAIAAAFEVPVDRVERAVQVSNDFGEVARTARDDGVDGLDAIRLEVGRPVQSMLAQTGTVDEAIETWGTVGVEWKYDGARVQAHYDGTSATLFSRNMEDVTGPLPEIVEFIETRLEAPAILDGEVVAVDESGEPRPFQAVLRRFRRKHDVERTRGEVALQPHFFDCLHDDGTDLLDSPLTDRHDRLLDRLGASESAGVSELRLTDDPDEIAMIEERALGAGHEGIMLKNPASPYTPGRRGQNWRKRKPTVETIECVVTGAEWGEGRRATYLGTFELSVVGDEGFEPVGNVATGITDEELGELTERLEPHIRDQSGQSVELDPAVVFEVGYEEIQRSPTYASGYALRFPRFVAVREDLSPEEADTLDRIERLAEAT